MDNRNLSLSPDSGALESCAEEIESPDEENERKVLEKKLFQLRKEKAEKNLLAKCIDSIHARSFLSKHLVPSLQETNRSRGSRNQERLCVIKQLKSEKEELNDAAHSICQDNRSLEKQIRRKKLQLKDLVKERSKYWNEAVAAHLLSLGKVKNPENLDRRALVFSHHKPNKYFENRFKLLSARNKEKSHQILHLSLILHNLICFSGEPWAHDKNLLDVVLCTGKILGMNFGASRGKDKRKALDDFIHILDNVKL